MIRSKYALSDTGQIEAPGRPLRCVSSKNEDGDWDLEKNRDILKINKKKNKVVVGRAYDAHVVKRISKIAILKNDALLLWLGRNMRSQIEAPGRPLKCVSSKNEDLDWDVEKIRIFWKLKNTTKSHIYKVKSFQKWKKFRRHFLSHWHSVHTPPMLTASTIEIYSQTPKFNVFFLFDHPRH